MIHRLSFKLNGHRNPDVVFAVTVALQCLKVIAGISEDELLAFELLWTPQVRAEVIHALTRGLAFSLAQVRNVFAQHLLLCKKLPLAHPLPC